MNIVGWCKLHHFMIPRDKFNQKCKRAFGGKRCQEFTYKIPDYKKKHRSKIEGRGRFDA